MSAWGLLLYSLFFDECTALAGMHFLDFTVNHRGKFYLWKIQSSFSECFASANTYNASLRIPQYFFLFLVKSRSLLILQCLKGQKNKTRFML